MQLLPELHQIPVNYKNRPLKLYLLQGPDIKMLMDTGDASTPESDILPYFQSINFDPKSLTHVMATHPDLDHTGGLARIKQAASPNTQFVCGTLDRTQVESPEGLIDIRYRAHYHFHQLGPDDKARQAMLPRCGAYVPIHTTYAGGETLRFSKDQYLQILHLPGHSHGHLGVFLPWQNTAIIGDAVHGTANRFLDGKAAFACTYMYIEEYLGTIDRLLAMKLDRLYSCHWPDCTTNDEVTAFLTQSRDYALQANQSILETVTAAGQNGLTLKEVCLQAKPRLGDWPPEKDLETRSMAHGHLTYLTNAGHLSASDTIPIRYTHNPIWKGLK
jgi:glyoxylase-like metal-dependent hydrolase (beta-lactamase superfamily II)